MAKGWKLFVLGLEGDQGDVIRGAQSPFVQLKSVIRNFIGRPAACMCDRRTDRHTDRQSKTGTVFTLKKEGVPKTLLNYMKSRLIKLVKRSELVGKALWMCNEIPRVALKWTLTGKSKRGRDQRSPGEGVFVGLRHKQSTR